MKLTILTSRKTKFRTPILKLLENIFYETLKFFKIFHQNSIGGHYAVTRSVLAGLKKNSIDFNYNPIFNFDINEEVVVLEGIEILYKAIELKKNNRIKKLHVGPNVITRSINSNSIISSDYIDSIIVPSQWVEVFYKEDLPALTKKKFIIWAAGVNLEKINQQKIKKTCLIYFKSGDINLAFKINKFLNDQNIITHFVEYGKYKKNQYIEALKKSTFSVFMSESESQGIAMFEAWSCNVPTFVWSNPNEIVINEKVINYHSTSPYLISETGVFFNDYNDFLSVYKANIDYLDKFNPRKIVKKFYTDTQSIKYLLNKINY